jgi:hypothetical protein
VGFHNAVRDYHQAITKNGGSVMLFMTWDFVWNKQNPEFFKKLVAAYEEIGTELDIPVIPVGLIWDDANKAPFTGEQAYFLNGQDLHQTEKGSAANASSSSTYPTKPGHASAPAFTTDSEEAVAVSDADPAPGGPVWGRVHCARWICSPGPLCWSPRPRWY